MRPSAWAIVVLIVLVLLLFGARQLPRMASDMGRSLKIFRKEIRELTDDEPGNAQFSDSSESHPGAGGAHPAASRDGRVHRPPDDPVPR